MKKTIDGLDDGFRQLRTGADSTTKVKERNTTLSKQCFNMRKDAKDAINDVVKLLDGGFGGRRVYATQVIEASVLYLCDQVMNEGKDGKFAKLIFEQGKH